MTSLIVDFVVRRVICDPNGDKTVHVLIDDLYSALCLQNNKNQNINVLVTL